MKNFTKNIVLWIIVGLLLVALFNLFQGTASNRSFTELSFSDFIVATDTGNVSEVKIRGNQIQGYFDDGRPFSTYSPNYPNLVEKLNSAGVKITAEPADKVYASYIKCIAFLVSYAFTNWCLDFFYASNARWRWKSIGFWKVKS